MKITLKSELIPFLIIVASVLVSILSYPYLPAQVPTHWGIAGTPDAYGSKLTHSIFIPALIIGIYLLFLALPYIDPKRANYEDFAGVYTILKIMILGFMLGVQMLTIEAVFAPEQRLAVNYLLAMLGVMFIVIGNYMAKIRPSWFVGIKTPWTLSNNEVWRRTHRVGGWGFVLFGLATLALAPFNQPKLQFLVFIGGALVASLGPIIYSYLLYRRLEQEKTRK
ncbi:MAG: SdpI family protein [Firmicutes bacterium]|nr:SdpI family protein [Bacillota bacterium]